MKSYRVHKVLKKSYRVHMVLDPARPGNDNTLQPKGAEG